MVFVFGSVYVMDYVCRFAYVEPDLHPWDEVYLIVMDTVFDVLLHLVCQYFIEEIFASMFFMDIGPKFSFLVGFLPGFGIRMMFVS